MNKLRSSEYAKSSREMNLELQTGLTITTLFETK